MKLYIKPGACSLASHIVLNETGADFTTETVDTTAKTTASGEDFLTINPNGYVPALRLNSDIVLTEGAAILQYVADQKPETGLTPPVGTVERARVQSYLNFVSSELHKAFGPLFNPNSSDAEREAAKAAVAKKLDYVESQLADGRDFLTGDRFTVADSYLFVVINWTGFTGIDLASWPKLAAFHGRVAGRPATQAAMKAEGLIQ